MFSFIVKSIIESLTFIILFYIHPIIGIVAIVIYIDYTYWLINRTIDKLCVALIKERDDYKYSLRNIIARVDNMHVKEIDEEDLLKNNFFNVWLYKEE